MGFKNLMKYMFGFINHNKQMENLVEKLLKRLDAAEERNWGRITWCLSEIKWSKTYKIVKKLLDTELQKLYMDKLGRDDVWEPFEKIIQECGKVKLETNDKNEFEEWKKRAEEANKKPKNKRKYEALIKAAKEGNEQSNDDGQDEEAEEAAQPPKKKQKVHRKPVARKSRKKRNVVEEE